MSKVLRKRAALIAAGAAALLAVAAGSALAAGLGGTKVNKGILTYDGTASVQAPMTLIGTALGDTWYGQCVPSNGHVYFFLALQTHDGSWTATYSDIDYNDRSNFLGYASAGFAADPPGTYSNPNYLREIGDENGGGADRQDDIVQLGPSPPGHLIFHMTAYQYNSTCHATIEVASDKIASSVGVARVPPSTSRPPSGVPGIDLAPLKARDDARGTTLKAYK